MGAENQIHVGHLQDKCLIYYPISLATHFTGTNSHLDKIKIEDLL